MAMQEFNISRILSQTLDTREAASFVAKTIKSSTRNSAKIVVNFDGITFMSRSFADQFFKELFSTDAQLNLIIKNANSGITEVLDIVAKTQISRKKIENTHSSNIFSDISQLESYMVTW